MKFWLNFELKATTILRKTRVYMDFVASVNGVQSNLYINIPYISITSLLALTLLARVWDYGYNSILENLYKCITFLIASHLPVPGLC